MPAETVSEGVDGAEAQQAPGFKVNERNGDFAPIIDAGSLCSV
jgi:hypothetical protein